MEYSIKPKRLGGKENNPLPSKEDNWIIRSEMSPMNVMQYVSTAAFTGDDNKAGLFIAIMVVMALIIIGLVVFSIISNKKNADNEGEGTQSKKNETDQK